MSYSVKEIYFTLQGEGAQTGRPAVFCRFTGCNLWTGREEDRMEAICRFCDTEFVGTDGPGGGSFETAESLAAAVDNAWPDGEHRLVVCTGGEPLLQLDAKLVSALQQRRFDVAVETNGTIRACSEIDWVCVSPKANTEVVQRSGDELKLVYPQDGAEPELFTEWEFAHFFLQPMDGPSVQENTQRAIKYCLSHPRWRLSVQTHKLLGLP